jgi:hypothetical protein
MLNKEITLCQFVGDQDPSKQLLTFCGAPTLPGKSYCLEHYPIIYQKGTAISGRKKIKDMERELRHIQSRENAY